MKKRVLSFILAICLIIPCAFMFTGCDKETKEPKLIYVNTVNELRVAMEESEAGTIVKLGKNFDLNTRVVVSTKVTLDLNGSTVSALHDTVGDGIFMVVGGGELTIVGEGIVNSATQYNNYSRAIYAKDGGKVIINSGSFINVGAKEYESEDVANTNALVYAGDGGQIIIEGGSFIGNVYNETHGAKFTLNAEEETDASIVVKGGSFKCYNPSINESSSQIFVAEGYVVEISGEGENTWYNVVVEK